MSVVGFAGDNVYLAGQINYPSTPMPPMGYPLVFILPHAGCTGMAGYEEHARYFLAVGWAVFRWDKRGTGRSGSGGIGSALGDVLAAYRTALNQPHICAARVVIFAQSEGTALLGEQYAQFAEIQRPIGVILAGNMLDETAITRIDAPIHFVTGDGDWNYAAKYATAACQRHNAHYGYGSSVYIAKHATRRLLDARNNTLHVGAFVSIQNWLEKR